jgi:hypothetical protein
MSILRKLTRFLGNSEHQSALELHAQQVLKDWKRMHLKEIYLIKEYCQYFRQGLILWQLRFSLQPTKNSRITYWVMSLETQERASIVQLNRGILPMLRVWKSVNGYQPKDTEQALAQTGLKLHSLDSRFGTYGTLACFLTKYLVLMDQVERGHDYVCMIEDDMVLKDEFPVFVQRLTLLFRRHKSLNMVRLGPWGEGYPWFPSPEQKTS